MALATVITSATVAVACGGADDDCLPANGHSVARVWNEAALDAIRADFPAPTVHARNLFHLSVAMWDSYALYEPGATPVLTNGNGEGQEPSESDGELSLDDRRRSQRTAISHAAYELLTERYRRSVGGDESLVAFDELLAALCLEQVSVPSGSDASDVADETPAEAGTRIARTILANTVDDGSLESEQYVAPFEVVNEPLVLAESGTTMADPNRWQQLLFVEARTQNGQLLVSNVQDYIGPHWGWVTPFALEPAADGLPIDPGPPPMLGTATETDFALAAQAVVRASAALDPADGVRIDISPASIGNSSLGTDDGVGHPVNPTTGEPYEEQVVPAGDFYRVIAEFWADGPDSETPPGHWNSLTNTVGDRLPVLQIGGTGDEVDRLTWDVSTYLALNGALHDSAIAAWGAKFAYDYVRPISMIRHLGVEGRLPLEDGLVETITEDSAASGERHELLADHLGETAILAWQREPAYFGEDLAPVRWILAVDWMPYQRTTFVTPAFPGYVSGHSTFSRAAAEVLTAMTGDPYFPGGMGTHDAGIGALEFEDGPSQPLQLQWATYADAADQAGLSRIYGGIHVSADDYEGRLMGAEVGNAAWEEVQQYFPNRS